jgi:LuxR family transcriptional regulator, maltose regulon positive regulatory protein
LPDLAGFARRFFRELFMRLGSDATLVFDNCHSAATEYMDIVFREAIEEIPSGMSIILISRMEPPTALARARLNNQLLEIDWNELRLSFEESVAIAELRHGANMTNVSELHRRADGWVAGLVALMSTRSTGLTQARTSQHDILFDYFASEIFERASPQQQSILMKTAVFHQFSVPMAVAVTGDSTVEQLLDDLYRSQCFIERSAGTNAYRYHEIFREFLASQLAKLDATAIRAARVRAAEVLEQQGASEAAIELYLDAGDFSSAADLIRKNAPSMADQGRHIQLGSWLARLPEPCLDEDPWLIFWLGTGQLLTNAKRARVTLERAYQTFAKVDDAEGELFSVHGILLAMSANWDSTDLYLPWIEVLAQRLAGANETVPIAARLRGWYAYLRAACEAEPGHRLIPTAIEWLKEQLFEGAISDGEKLELAEVLLGIELFTASQQIAQRIIDLAEPIARKESAPPVPRLLWFFGHGSFLCHVGETVTSMKVLGESVALGKQYGIPGLSYWAHAMRAYCHWSLNEAKAAAGDIDEMRGIAEQAGFPKTVFEYKGRALVASQWGDVSTTLILPSRRPTRAARLTCAHSRAPTWRPSRFRRVIWTKPNDGCMREKRSIARLSCASTPRNIVQCVPVSRSRATIGKARWPICARRCASLATPACVAS